MDDTQIIDGFFARDPTALDAAQTQYAPRLMHLAKNILPREDAEEVVNDTWLRAWNAIPPARPARLGAYLSAVTRRLALDRWRENRAEKRGGTSLPLLFSELEDCLPDPVTPEDVLAGEDLQRAIEDFLADQPKEKRVLFLRRYWYADSVGDIARRMHMSENAVSVTLNRLRTKLKSYLERRGFTP